jgi:glycosyltransferase involved in cell wall biosynthesis
MRVLMLSKACLVGAYQRKLEEIAAQPGIELTVAVPPAWRDERGTLRLERAYVRGYDLVVEPLWFNGSFHLHFYPQLGRLLARVRPDLIHLDEEPYNFATWHAQRLARRQGALVIFFTWQNLFRRYPWPFSYFERQVLCGAAAGIAGNREAAGVWRDKGYRGPLPVIPQFGVDPDLFKPHPAARAAADPAAFVVGYAGRLVREKGLDLLLRAVAQLPPAVQLHLVGSGPEQGRLLRLAADLGLGPRLRLTPLMPSLQMPRCLASLDCLVLPSRTLRNWKEQFGRVLIEAMACGVPVIASDCGELPHVVDTAGLIFPEGDVAALARHLRTLYEQPALRADLAARGRARVLEHYTQRQIAADTVALYRRVMDKQS